MPWPFVSREAYDERGRALHDVRLERDRLLNTIDELRTEFVRMRRDGFTPAKPATVRESPDDEREALARAEQQLIQRRDDAAFIARAKTDIMERNPQISEAAALEEARRLRRSVTDEDPPT
jgi:hypothetical protein